MHLDENINISTNSQVKFSHFFQLKMLNSKTSLCSKNMDILNKKYESSKK